MESVVFGEMENGVFSVFHVMIFPRPWPKAEPFVLFEHTEPVYINLACATDGHLTVSTEVSAGERVTYDYQKLVITGSGKALARLLYNNGDVSLYINEKEVMRASECAKSFTLEDEYELAENDSDLFTRYESFIDVKTDHGFFIQTLNDLMLKTQKNDLYESIRAAALLRQLLIDGPPLVTRAMKHNKTKPQYQVNSGLIVRSPIETELDTTWINPDVSLVPGASPSIVAREQFISLPCLKIEGRWASIADVILLFAHKKGGAHKYNLREKDTTIKTVLSLDEVMKVAGKEPSLAVLKSICRITITALRPLADEIMAAYKSSSR